MLKGKAASFVKNQTGTFSDMSLLKSRFGYVCSRVIMRVRIFQVKVKTKIFLKKADA